MKWCPSCTYSILCSSTACRIPPHSVPTILAATGLPLSGSQMSHEHEERTQRRGAAHVTVKVFHAAYQITA
jgi:hypothetical protein